MFEMFEVGMLVCVCVTGMPIFCYFLFFPLFLARSFLYFLLFHLSLSVSFFVFVFCERHAHVDFQLFSQKSSGIPGAAGVCVNTCGVCV